MPYALTEHSEQCTEPTVSVYWPIAHDVHCSAFTVSLYRPGSHEAHSPRLPRCSPGRHSGVGDGVGLGVGLAVGTAVGDGVGAAVGDGVGDGVGLGVGIATHAVCAIIPFVHVIGPHASQIVDPSATEYESTSHGWHCSGIIGRIMKLPKLLLLPALPALPTLAYSPPSPYELSRATKSSLPAMPIKRCAVSR